MKGNGFDTGLTSQIILHLCLQKNSSNAKQSVSNHCSAMDQSVSALKANKKVNFQFWRINKVEKFFEATEVHILKKH